MVLSVIFGIAFSSQAIAAESWAQVAGQIETEQAKDMQAAAETEKLVQMDREAIQKELNSLKAQEKSEDIELNKLKKEFESLLKTEEQLTADLEAEQDEIEAVQGTVRAAAREASTIIRDNPITPEFPEEPAFLNHLLELTYSSSLSRRKPLVPLSGEQAISWARTAQM